MSPLPFRYFALSVLMSFTMVQADEVSDMLAKAATSYQGKHYSETLEHLNDAKFLINRHIAMDLLSHLPESPDGWKAGEPIIRSNGGEFFEGGNSVIRTYTRESEKIELTLTANSPSLPSVLMLINNPAFLEGEGKRIERLSSQKSILEWNEEGRGSLTVVVGDAILVSIDGTDTTLENLRSLARAVDYRKLAESVGH